MTEKPFIGQMDRKVSIQKETFVQSSTGELKPTYVTIATPFAHMKENSGGEDVEGKVRHLISRTYTIRFNQLIVDERTKLRLTDGNLVYNVYHLKEIGRRSHLQLLVTVYE